MLPTETVGQRHSSDSSPLTFDLGNDLEGALAGLWQELLGLELVNLDDDFFELGGHSLIGVQLFNRIEQTYGLQFGLSTLFEYRTVRQLAQHIRLEIKAHKYGSNAKPLVVRVQPRGSLQPVFLIPGGYGTTVLPFREVSLLLGSDQPVYGFEAEKPGPGEELESIPDRAARFVEELRSIQPRGPYSLVGWCGGGYVAFEMAQLLAKQGQKVAFLGMVECAVPRYPASWTGKMRFSSERAAWRAQNFLKLGPKGMARWAADRCKSLAAAMLSPGRSKDAQLLENAIPPLPQTMNDLDERAWQNVARYHPKPYPGKTVILVGADSWNYRGVSSAVDPRLAWRKLSEGGSEVRTVPGDHLEMLKTPYSDQFAKELKSCLEASRPSRR